MQINVNGDTVNIAVTLLDQALEELGFACDKVVVARNETFVPREDWADTVLQNGDRLDVLAPIGGG